MKSYEKEGNLAGRSEQGRCQLLMTTTSGRSRAWEGSNAHESREGQDSQDDLDPGLHAVHRWLGFNMNKDSGFSLRIRLPVTGCCRKHDHHD